MTTTKPTSKTSLLLLNASALGILVLAVFIVKNYAQTPVRDFESFSEKAIPKVDVRELTKSPFEWQIKNFGRILPSRSKTQSSRVNAAISTIAKNLKVGQRFKQGEVLINFDQTEYEYELAMHQLTLANSQNNLQEILTEKSFNKRLIKLAQERLKLAETEKERYQKLEGTDAGLPLRLDRAKGELKRFSENIVNLQKQLALADSREKKVSLQLKQTELKIKKAEYELANCIVRMPERGQILSVAIEQGQALTKNALLFTYLAEEKVRELSVEINPQDLNRLDINPETESFPKSLKISVTPARFSEGEKSFTADISRIEPASPENSYFPVVLSIKDPGSLFLKSGSFCNVTFNLPTTGRFLVRDVDVHNQNKIYLLREGKLNLASVNILGRQNSSIIIEPVKIKESGLNSFQKGDMLITSPLQYAVNGMQLEQESK